MNSGAAVTLQPKSGDPPIIEYVNGARDVMQRKAHHELDAFSVFNTLLDNSADINQDGRGGRTALSICCSCSGLEGHAQYLLKHAADPHIADESGDTPLHNAAIVGALSLVELLIAYGASSSRRNNKGKLPANRAAYNGTSVETLKILVQGSNATQLDRDTMLAEASRYGFLEMLQYLIKVDANPNTEIEDDSCALSKVMDRNRQAEEPVAMLFQKTRADFTTRSGKTALHHLVASYEVSQSCSMVRLLVERGANLEALRKYRKQGPEFGDGCLLVTSFFGKHA